MSDSRQSLTSASRYISFVDSVALRLAELKVPQYMNAAKIPAWSTSMDMCRMCDGRIEWTGITKTRSLYDRTPLAHTNVMHYVHAYMQLNCVGMFVMYMWSCVYDTSASVCDSLLTRFSTRVIFSLDRRAFLLRKFLAYTAAVCLELRFVSELVMFTSSICEITRINRSIEMLPHMHAGVSDSAIF